MLGILPNIFSQFFRVRIEKKCLESLNNKRKICKYNNISNNEYLAKIKI